LSLALPGATTFAAGIDWAAAEHAVCVMDKSGKVVASFTIRHDADGLRRLTRRLRVAAPYSGQARALRTVVRTREDLVEMRVAAANQLAALLETWWPGARSLFADIESPIALEFLTRYPTPASAARLGEGRMAAFCARQHYSGRRSAAELVTRLRTAAPGTLDEALTPALRDAVLALVAVLRALNTAVRDVTRSVSDRLAEQGGSWWTARRRSGPAPLRRLPRPVPAPAGPAMMRTPLSGRPPNAGAPAPPRSPPTPPTPPAARHRRPPQDPVDHLPVIPPPAIAPARSRQQRLDRRPRLIRQLTTPAHRGFIPQTQPRSSGQALVLARHTAGEVTHG
jgi:hypothetical protein